MYNIASLREDWTFEEINQHYPNHRSFHEIACVCESCEVMNEPCTCSVRISVKNSNDQIYRPLLNLHPRKWFLILLSCAKLKFVAYTSSKLERTCSEDTQCSSWSRFRILKISCKIGDLKQSQSALFCSVPHMTILCVLTCVMNVGDQTRWSFVTSFGPLRNRSCKFVHWPQHIRSSNIRAKYKHFRTIWEHTFDKSPADFNSSSLKWWSSMHGVDTL